MKTFPSFLALSVLGLATVHADPFDKAQVTQTVQTVSLVDQQNGSQPAKVGDTVISETAVKTGADSRAELTFPDQTILRLGADAFFTFKAGGRSMNLESGTMLFSSPKGEGGGQVQAGAVTAAVTGTNFLFSLLKNGDVKLVVLEGKVFLYFTANPTVRREFKAGELITIPKDDTVIGYPVTINLKRLIATSRLLEASGFPPLPREVLLTRVADSQQGHIKHLPGSTVRDRETAQTTRRQDAQNNNNNNRPPQIDRPNNPDNKPPRPVPTPPRKPPNPDGPGPGPAPARAAAAPHRGRGQALSGPASSRVSFPQTGLLCHKTYLYMLIS